MIAVVRINTASPAELETLPGIGSTLAARIVNDRATREGFSRPEDLLEVDGITEGRLEAIRSHISFAVGDVDTPLDDTAPEERARLMESLLTVELHPESPLSQSQQSRDALFARLKYTRLISSGESDDDGAPGVANISGSHVEAMPPDGAIGFVVTDRAPGSGATLNVETAQGSVLWDSGELAITDGTTAVEVPVSVFEAASQRSEPVGSAVLVRSGRFVHTDDARRHFAGYRMFTAAIRPGQLDDGSANPQIPAVRRLLGLDGSGELTEFETAAIGDDGVDAGAANTIGFQYAAVRSDGYFDVSIDIRGDEIGWLWLLLGPTVYAGYQLDPLPTEPRNNVVIVLPPGGEETSESPESAPSETLGSATTSPAAAPPLDFDERELIDHPSLFNDDPGRTCFPFENPNRVLGERAFHTVLRIDQPDVGGLGSIKVSPPIALDLAPNLRYSHINKIAESSSGRDDVSSGGGAFTNLSNVRMFAAAASVERSETSEFLKAAIKNPLRVRWADWVAERSKPRENVSDDNPIEWEGDPSIYQASSVAGGHVLEWRVQWRSNGYSLGDIAHTLTLAPRQTRRIAKVSWRRHETAARREDTETRDALTQVTNRERDYTDAVQSSLSEWSKGGSKSRTTGVAGGVGFAMGPVVIGGGAAHGRASSSSWQQGGRRVAAAEQQNLRDAIRQYGQSVRSLESTVITEVTQEEEVEGVSEVLRNINFCHALSVVYYEILRHIRVDTAFSGVRECLFVPFSITPFNVDKALKWREQLRNGMLDRTLRWALDRLDEVASAWAGSDVPPGPRSRHPINHVTGSLYVQLSIERPRELAAEEELESYLANVWRPLAPVLGVPVQRIREQLEQRERNRDDYFQREIAPTLATKWANRLEFELEGTPLDGADFTLATQYRFGRTVRIDFTLPVDDLTREDLQEITVKTQQGLPEGSVANLQHMSIDYYTDHFNRRVTSDRGARDLIDSDSGSPDAGGAIAFLPLTAWERQDLREVIEDAVERLIVHLNANLVYYHKVIWWLMDRDEIYMLLDGFTAPYARRYENGEWVEDKGRSLASVVERDPMAILGNTLVFRVAAGAFLGVNGHQSPEDARRYYYDSQVRSEPLRVSLPTEGLYAQALMDNCSACEEHAGSTDWVLTQDEPELESLADQLGTRRTAPQDLTPTEFPESIISLQNAPAAPAPAGFADLLNALTSAESFRDMAGLAGTQASALGALKEAASLASGFGQKAIDFQKAKQGTDDAKKKLDNIKKAKSEKLIDDDEAKKQASNVLNEQNMEPQKQKLTSEGPVSNALRKAGETGQPVEIQRHTQDGSESVRVGKAFDVSEAPPRPFIIENPDLTPQARVFNARANDKSGSVSFSVRVPEMPSGGSIRWSVPPPASGRYVLKGNNPTQIGNQVDITALQPGLTEIDVAVVDSGGVVTESMKLPLCVPQFVTIDADAAFTTLMEGHGLITEEIEDLLRHAKEVCDLLLNTANVRTVWLMSPFNEALPSQFASGGAAAGNLTTAVYEGGSPPHTRYGQTNANSGGIGPTDYDETIQVWPTVFTTSVSGSDNEHVDEVTNEVVAELVANIGVSSPVKARAIEIYGRLLGETLAHEMGHSLVGRTLTDGFHHADPGLDHALMNKGYQRSFQDRTGFELTGAVGSADLTTLLVDHGIGLINIPLGDTQDQLDRHFPVPPTFS